MSELYGRQILFITTFGAFTFFNAGVCGSQNMWTVIILRFFAGSFGSSPLTNAGGVIADMFSARHRGIATAIFAAAPFLGPAVGEYLMVKGGLDFCLQSSKFVLLFCENNT
jgi:MFS family permease